MDCNWDRDVNKDNEPKTNSSFVQTFSWFTCQDVCSSSACILMLLGYSVYLIYFLLFENKFISFLMKKTRQGTTICIDIQKQGEIVC